MRLPIILTSVIALLLGLMAEPSFAYQGGSPASPSAQGGQASAPPAINWLTVEQTNKVAIGQYVFLRAKIVSIQPPRPGSRQPWSFFLGDESGTTRLIVYQDMYEKLSNPKQFAQGAIVEVFAETGEYRSQRQLVLRRETHIRLQPGAEGGRRRPSAANFAEDIYVPVSIVSLNKSLIGRKITVTGTIKSFEKSDAPNRPNRVTLQDGTSEVEILYWPETARAIPSNVVITKGNTLSASGVVTEFDGKLQVRVDKGEHLKPPDRQQQTD